MERDSLTNDRPWTFLFMHGLFITAMVSLVVSIFGSWDTASWLARAAGWVAAVGCLSFWRLWMRQATAPPTMLETFIAGDGPYRTGEVCASCGRPPPATQPVYDGEMGDVLYVADPDGKMTTDDLRAKLIDERLERTRGNSIPKPPRGSEYE